MNTLSRFYCIVAAALICFRSVEAQSERTSFITGSNLYTGVHCEYWNYQKSRTLETVVPLYYSMDLAAITEGLALDLVTSPTFALYSDAVTTDPFFGVANTKLRASYNYEKLVLVTAGIQIPIGTNKLSAQESQVAGAVSTRQMAFKVARIGSGLDMDLTAASSLEIMDNLCVGAAAGFLLHNPYVPHESGAKFNPGDEISFTLGADYTLFTEQIKARLMGDLLFTLYTPDREAGEKVFHAGPRLTVTIMPSVTFANGNVNALAASFMLRSGDEHLSPAGGVERDAGDDIVIANRYYFASPDIQPHALAKMSIFSPDASLSTHAFVVGFGGGFAPRINRQWKLRSEAAIEIGAMNKNFLWGIEIGGGLQFAF
ncbi:MAG: hypothetical protein GF401_03225 [Chitinivibrionales bacterium]|nr:hypothetical protein [Chitinivibrionales bacterium]